jgi:hypothetical protein
MNFTDRSHDSCRNSESGTTDPRDRADVELLGGEPSEGSGFEDETPAPEFQDLKLAQPSRKGGRK